jgi:CRP-like cAMP-binding protein
MARRQYGSCPKGKSHVTQSIYKNSLLIGMAPDDLNLLRRHLERVPMELRFQFEFPDKPVPHVYFLEHGLGSVLASGREDRQIEVGVLGRESVSGPSVILGDGRSPYATFMQVAGFGLRIESDRLRGAMDESIGLRLFLTKAAYAFTVQVAYTALANGHAKIEERLARWLLMCQDRLEGNQMPLTHEFLSLMLGVRRAGVTEAAQSLEQKGLIRSERGAITVVHRGGLKHLAGGLYGVPEREYERLTGCSIWTSET